MPKVIKIFLIILSLLFVAPLFSQEGEINFSANTAIAYDSVNNRYLRVSLEDPKNSQNASYFSGNFIVYGTLINYYGEVIGEKFPITNHQCYYPHVEGNLCRLRCDVAFDWVNQRYLVVWPSPCVGRGTCWWNEI